MYGQYPYGTPSYMGNGYQSNYPYQRQNVNQQMQYQPQQQMQPQQTFETPIQDIRFVTREEANAYIVYPNTKALLIDRNGCIAHLKSADNMGQSASRYFKFVEVNADGSPIKPQEPTPQIDMGEYIKKSDLANLGYVTMEQLNTILSKLTSQQNQPTGVKSNGNGTNTKPQM